MNNTGNIPPQFRNRGFGWGSAVVLVGVLLLVAWGAWRIGLDFRYEWHFEDMPKYLLYWDDNGQMQLGVLGKGLLLTLRLSLWAVALGLILGFILALGRLSVYSYFRLTSRTVVEISRNVPPLVLIFIASYFLSAQLLPWDNIIDWVYDLGPTAVWITEAITVRLVDMGVFFPAVFALAIYEAAYFSEIFRGAIISIDQGQWEASYCLGLKRWQQYRFIILPQVFRRAAPQLAGQFIATLKESSIVSVVSLAELTYSGQQLSTSSHRLFEVWITVAALYFIFNFTLSTLFLKLEK